MRKSTMRIEDACAWRKALANHPDETITILISALRHIVLFGNRSASEHAVAALTEAGFETGLERNKK